MKIYVHKKKSLLIAIPEGFIEWAEIPFKIIALETLKWSYPDFKYIIASKSFYKNFLDKRNLKKVEA